MALWLRRGSAILRARWFGSFWRHVADEDQQRLEVGDHPDALVGRPQASLALIGGERQGVDEEVAVDDDGGGMRSMGGDAGYVGREAGVQPAVAGIRRALHFGRPVRRAAW